MSESSAPAPLAWIVSAHTFGALLLGALEAVRLGSPTLALVVVPLFAAMGVAIGLAIAVTERSCASRAWWLRALVVAAPTAVVAVPIARTLFEGAYAQTLPIARAMPVVMPLGIWIAVAVAIALGTRLLRNGDLISRAIVLLACAGVIGAIVWVERHVLGTGYPDAHLGATIALVVVGGVAVRVTRRRSVSPYLAAAIAACALGAATAATLDGLHSPSDRRQLAAVGEHARDVVRLVRLPFDADADGNARLLGGGDCDDSDPRVHPGAPDVPEDGIDQDCDGADAIAPRIAPVPVPKPLDLAAWRARPEVRAVLDRTASMHVLVITVDALRFDVLAPETTDRTEFPHLTKLLDDSVWFTRAFSPGAGTDLALGTLLTGRLDPFQPIETTLLEAVRALGYKTSTTFPVEVVRYVGKTLLERGVDRVGEVHTDWGTKDVGDHVSAPATTDEGIAALEAAAGARAFVWLHYFDVHEHHQIKVPKQLRAAVTAGPNEKRNTYRALLLAIDREVGRVRAELATRGLADTTIILFVSDHGESLGEARLGETHGKVTYAPLVRIPLAIHIPGVAGGRREDPASMIDIAPTLLALLGAPAAMSPLEGVDLVPALLSAPEPLRQRDRAIVIHEELQWSVVRWPYQLIVHRAEDLVELYDLSADPDQSQDLSRSRPQDVADLRAHYAAGPQVQVDRTSDGRKKRERQAQPPPPRAPPSGAGATSTP